MQSRRHRMRQQQRRESARGWISSGTTVTIKTYTRRYGVDRYTAYEDLTALGFPLPDSAQHWAQRPPPAARPRRQLIADTRPLDTEWIMLEGRALFVAGHTPGGFPYGIVADETHDDHDLGEVSSLPDCDIFGPEPDAPRQIARPRRKPRGSRHEHVSRAHGGGASFLPGWSGDWI